jgi:hypothetical protein
MPLTKLVVVEKTLDTTNERLEGKAPPISDRSKKSEEHWEVQGYMMIWLVIVVGMDHAKVLNIAPHTFKVSIRTCFGHRMHRSKRYRRDERHGMVKYLTKFDCSII